MTSLDVLYYSLAFGFLVLVGFISYTLFTVTENLKLLKLIMADVKDVTKDVQTVKDGVKSGLGSLFGMFFNKAK